MLEIKGKDTRRYVKMAVVGIGGGGNNAINRMAAEGLVGVDLIAVNTDAQVLDESLAGQKIQIGIKETAGMGAGARAEIGEKSAEESEDTIHDVLMPYQMVFITCGMGGGTGTGASPVIAKIAKSMGILTVGVVTLPFEFEGRPRMDVARLGVEKFRENVDTMIVIPNEKLTEVYPDLTIDDAFKRADEVLHNTVSGISNIILNCGTINLDFGDLCTVLKDKGMAHIGIGVSGGHDAAKEALEKAIHSPLLETTIQGASHILLNVEGQIGMKAMKEAGDTIRDIAGENVNILWGTVGLEKDVDQITITLIATGISEKKTGVASPSAESRASRGAETKASPVADRYKIPEIDIPVFLKKHI